MRLPVTPWSDVNALIVRLAIAGSIALDELRKVRLDLVVPRARQRVRLARHRWRLRARRAWAKVRHAAHPTPFSKGWGSRPGVSAPPKTRESRKGP